MSEYKKTLQIMDFIPEEGTIDTYYKVFATHENYILRVHFDKKTINYGDKISVEGKTSSNFSSRENFVTLECVNRLLDKGYPPQCIIIEKTWPTGHGTSGRLDILVTRQDESAYLMIECKTWGSEFSKAFKRLEKDGGQLFTYFQQDKDADILMLYASEFDNGEIKFRNEIIKIEDDYRPAGNVKDFYDRWNKLPRTNGVFDSWVKPYEYQSKSLTKKDLKVLKQEDSSFVFNRFLEILRHNIVSDKPNAFNKIFTFFLCKIIDEDRSDDEQLHFQWLEGEDNHISFQKRLTDLYNRGMLELLEKKVTDISDSEFDKRFRQVDNKYRDEFKEILTEIRLKKNNEFAIKEVYNDDSFEENAKVVKEVVELLQKFKIRYNYRQQFLSDFFELLLTTGLKQESGQFFTPVPVARFIIRSIPLQDITKQKLKKGNKNELLPLIIDYASGSGHFITESMEEIQRIIESTDEKEFNPTTSRAIKRWKEDPFDWAEDYVYGIEKDYRLVKTAKVSCYLHGDGLAKIIHGDGLADFKTAEEYKDLLKITTKTYEQDNKQFDVVVSNPPYSISAFKGTLVEKKATNNFNLYKKLTDQSSEIECLFIERTKQLLKDGGIASIILPSSILSNTGIYTEAREIILKYFEIIAITELGSNTFMATGTNTVVLFLKRRNNADWLNIKTSVNKSINNLQDITINGIENPMSKYVEYIWQEITLEDYITLLQKQPNDNVKQQEIYQEYAKKIKAETEQELWNRIIELEQERLLYFLLAYPQNIVLIQTGEKKEEKQFLGYEFSDRRGNEGIHPIQRGRTIDECTRLFDQDRFENPTKASTYIYKAFQGDLTTEIHESLQKNIFRINLIDMMVFDRIDFEKTISLSAKKKIKSQWKLVRIGDLQEIDFVSGYAFKSGDLKDNKTKEDELPVLKIGNILLERNIVSLDICQFHSYINCESKIVTKNAIAIALTGATVGKTGWIKNKCLLNQRVLAVKGGNETISYVSIFLCSNIFYDYAQTLAHGNAQGNLSPGEVTDFEIPLPPKEIQKKIVSEIEVLEGNKKQAQGKIEILDETLRSTFNNINNKEIFKFSKISTLEYGKPLHKNQRINGIYPVMGSNGKVGTHNAFLIKGPAIIIGRKGSAGKVNFVNEDCFPIDTTFWVKYDNSKVHVKFFYYLLKELNLENIAKGKGVGVPGLNRNNVQNLKISIPSLEKQIQIVTEIDNIESEIKKLNDAINAIPQKKEEVLKKYL